MWKIFRTGDTAFIIDACRKLCNYTVAQQTRMPLVTAHGVG